MNNSKHISVDSSTLRRNFLPKIAVFYISLLIGFILFLLIDFQQGFTGYAVIDLLLNSILCLGVGGSGFLALIQSSATLIAPLAQGVMIDAEPTRIDLPKLKRHRDTTSINITLDDPNALLINPNKHRDFPATMVDLAPVVYLVNENDERLKCKLSWYATKHFNIRVTLNDESQWSKVRAVIIRFEKPRSSSIVIKQTIEK